MCFFAMHIKLLPTDKRFRRKLNEFRLIDVDYISYISISVANLELTFYLAIWISLTVWTMERNVSAFEEQETGISLKCVKEMQVSTAS